VTKATSVRAYAGGYSLCAFDLTADITKDDHFNLVKHGSVRLALKFLQLLPHTVSVVACAEFDNLPEIDKETEIYYWTSVFEYEC